MCCHLYLNDCFCMDTGLEDAKSCPLVGNEGVINFHNALCNLPSLGPKKNYGGCRWGMKPTPANDVIFGPITVTRSGNASFQGQGLYTLLNGLDKGTKEEQAYYVAAVKVS